MVTVDRGYVMNSPELKVAIYKKDIAEARRLLQKDEFNINKRFDYANATLWHLVAGGSDSEQINFLKFLLKSYRPDLNPDMLNQLDANSLTPIHWAAISENIKGIKLLISFGAEPNVRNLAGKTPLDLLIKHHGKNCASSMQSIIDDTAQLRSNFKQQVLDEEEAQPIKNNLIDKCSDNASQEPPVKGLAASVTSFFYHKIAKLQERRTEALADSYRKFM